MNDCFKAIFEFTEATPHDLTEALDDYYLLFLNRYEEVVVYILKILLLGLGCSFEIERVVSQKNIEFDYSSSTFKHFLNVICKLFGLKVLVLVQNQPSIEFSCKREEAKIPLGGNIPIIIEIDNQDTLSLVYQRESFDNAGIDLSWLNAMVGQTSSSKIEANMLTKEPVLFKIEGKDKDHQLHHEKDFMEDDYLSNNNIFDPLSLRFSEGKRKTNFMEEQTEAFKLERTSTAKFETSPKECPPIQVPHHLILVPEAKHSFTPNISPLQLPKNQSFIPPTDSIGVQIDTDSEGEEGPNNHQTHQLEDSIVQNVDNFNQANFTLETNQRNFPVEQSHSIVLNQMEENQNRIRPSQLKPQEKSLADKIRVLMNSNVPNDDDQNGVDYLNEEAGIKRDSESYDDRFEKLQFISTSNPDVPHPHQPVFRDSAPSQQRPAQTANPYLQYDHFQPHASAHAEADQTQYNQQWVVDSQYKLNPKAYKPLGLNIQVPAPTDHSEFSAYTSSNQADEGPETSLNQSLQKNPYVYDTHQNEPQALHVSHQLSPERTNLTLMEKAKKFDKRRPTGTEELLQQINTAWNVTASPERNKQEQPLSPNPAEREKFDFSPLEAKQQSTGNPPADQLDSPILGSPSRKGKFLVTNDTEKLCRICAQPNKMSKMLYYDRSFFCGKCYADVSLRFKKKSLNLCSGCLRDQSWKILGIKFLASNKCVKNDGSLLFTKDKKVDKYYEYLNKLASMPLKSPELEKGLLLISNNIVTPLSTFADIKVCRTCDKNFSKCCVCNLTLHKMDMFIGEKCSHPYCLDCLALIFLKKYHQKAEFTCKGSMCWKKNSLEKVLSHLINVLGTLEKEYASRESVY